MIKKTSESGLVQMCGTIWTHRETTNLLRYLACRDKQPMAVPSPKRPTPKRHPIWRTTQTHRKTSYLAHYPDPQKDSQSGALPRPTERRPISGALPRPTERRPIWRTTQTHRKTANLAHYPDPQKDGHSVWCQSSQQQWVHWRLPLPDP